MVSIMQGDITCIPSQAMVNSANPSLLAGGGVCGAIHRVAGPQLEAACRLVGPIGPGEAVLTDAFNLPAEYVIHAVAPRYLDGSRGEREGLQQTYNAICQLVARHSITSLSIPSIGTGIYRFPVELAGEIAVETLKNSLPNECHATFVCFDAGTFQAYQSRVA